MKDHIRAIALSITKAKELQSFEVIQELWSGYGKIIRVSLIGGIASSIVLKNILLQNKNDHPRGWNTNNSHQRKLKSYKVEMNWYQEWSQRCNERCRVPYLYTSLALENELILVLEDLNAAGYPLRKSSLNLTEVKLCIEWLANFHGTFMEEYPEDLWEIGTYWHLATRPDEYAKMENNALKQSAHEIDSLLNNCKYKTIVHGDAKVANFCFSEDMVSVSAVDFQYVGGGCGMKDLAYLLGSSLLPAECESWEEEVLSYYFEVLRKALHLHNKQVNVEALEKEWREMYPIAVTDFSRFLMGWMPAHKKINGYTKRIEKEVLRKILSADD